MKEIQAYETTDGRIFQDYDQAIDHQEGLQASAFLAVVNACLPERYRNQLTATDWYMVQKHVVERVKKSKEIEKTFLRFLATIENNQE